MEDSSQAPSRVPSLVQHCQRVAILHADSLSGVGYNVSFKLLKPVLDHCSASTLMRVEDATPNLKQDTNELWKKLCAKEFPLDALKYLEGALPEPQSWRQLYEDLYAARAKKLEEVQSKLRNQRLEESTKRKESNIKLADAHSFKRARTWGMGFPAQPKTLFQKTRTEATKTQRLFNSQQHPPMLATKAYRSTYGPAPSSTALTPLSSAALMSGKPNPRVVVRPMIAPTPPSTVSSPSTSSASSPPATASSQSSRAPAINPDTQVAARSTQVTAATPSMTSANKLTQHAPVKNVPVSANAPRTASPATTTAPSRPIKPLPGSQKPKSLFMPRHRAYNQLSNHSHVSPPR